jgi:isochorismate hydrolase
VKEAYFSPDTIQRKALEMLAGLQISARKPELVPEKSALLILDMQDYFLDPTSHAYVPSAGAILPGLQRVIAAYAQREYPIIFTQHINTSEDAAMMGVWWHELISADHPLKGISSALDTRLGTVLQKTQYDAFFDTDLQARLTNWGATQVVVCGVMTHLCCETTARSAFMQGYEVFFTIDGTATYNRKFHLATLSTLTHGFARPMLLDEVIAACRRGQ